MMLSTGEKVGAAAVLTAVIVGGYYVLRPHEDSSGKRTANLPPKSMDESTGGLDYEDFLKSGKTATNMFTWLAKKPTPTIADYQKMLWYWGWETLREALSNVELRIPNPGFPDGVIGRKTRAALSYFQFSKAVVDAHLGELDAVTKLALETAARAQYREAVQARELQLSEGGPLTSEQRVQSDAAYIADVNRAFDPNTPEILL